MVNKVRWTVSLPLLVWVVVSCSSAPPTAVGPTASAPAGSTEAASQAQTDKEDVPPEAATGYREVSAVTANKYMAAAANPHATRAGLEMLREGGTAVDAAIAMAMVLSLVEPQSSGIGGGAFLVHFDYQSGQVESYDGRETAPRAVTERLFLDSAGRRLSFLDAIVGGRSVGVPGELRMLEMAHREHGKLPWKRLFAPAIALAEGGFEISPRMHKLVAGDPLLSKMQVAREYFFAADGSPKKVGTRLENPKLAKVFRAVADGGADAFYKGAIADDIVAAVRGAKRNPGAMTTADLGQYRAKKRPALCSEYRAWEVCGMPPPSSGGLTTLQILGLLERFDLSKMDPESADFAHLFAEAGRLAYADRDRYIADPDFVRVPVAGLLDPQYLESRSNAIRLDRSMGKAAPGQPPGLTAHYAPDQSPELPSTSHIVAVDGEGDAISMTASIESAFGSRVMVRGFLLNNELTDFSFLPEVDGRPVQNRVQPGKRPRSSMSPTLVFERGPRRFLMATGSPGGSRIIPFVTRVLLLVLDFELNVQDAIASPNIVNRNGATELESVPGKGEWVKRTSAELEKRGHEVKVRSLNSGLQGIVRTEKGYVGGADPRREGIVLGN